MTARRPPIGHSPVRVLPRGESVSTPSQDTEDRLEALEHQLATVVIGHLCGLEQALRLYDINNAMVVKLLGEILDAVRVFATHADAPMSLAVVEHGFFVNRHLVRMSFTDYRKAQLLKSIMTTVAIGELIFPVDVTLAGLQEFARHLRAALASPLTSDLLSQPWGGIAARPVVAYEAKDQHERRAELTIKGYCTLVVLTRQTVARLQAGHRPHLLRIKRILQLLVDYGELSEGLLLALSRRLGARGELAVHLANVTLYSLLLGRRLRLSRSHLMSLGLAALFHDLPKGTLKETTLNALERPDALRPEDRERVATHWLNTLRTLLRATGLADEALARTVTLYESQLEFSRRDLYAAGAEGLALNSRIIALGDAFDTLCWPRAGRPTSPPHEAMTAVLEGCGARFDPALGRQFVELLGFYPAGTAVVLSTGEVAIALQTAEGGDPERPTVQIITDASGRRVERPPVIDLARDARRIRWSAESSRLGLNGVKFVRRQRL